MLWGGGGGNRQGEGEGGGGEGGGGGGEGEAERVTTQPVIIVQINPHRQSISTAVLV